QGTNAGATFETIKNCNIRAGGGGAGTTAGIFGIFAGGTAVSTNGNNNNFLTIQNNQIDTAYEAIAVRDLSATLLDGISKGLNINNNTIGSASPSNYVTFRGIELVGTAGAAVTQNEILNQITTTVNNNIAGIELASTNYYADVSRNKVHDIINNNPAKWGNFGIYLSTATNNFSNSIVNNAIWSLTNVGLGTAAGLSFGTINYNDYYSPGTGGVSGFLNMFGLGGGGSDVTTLAAWQSETQGDQNSLNVNPQFLSSNDLRLAPGSPAAGAGQT